MNCEIGRSDFDDKLEMSDESGQNGVDTPIQNDSAIEMQRQIPCIIVVDDDKLMRDLLQNFTQELQPAKYLEAESAEQCLELIQNPQDIPPGSVMITDYLMPGMNGYNLAHLLRAAKRQDMTIILCSGGGYDEEQIAKAIQHGIIDGLIKKPFDVEEVVNIVREKFDARQAIIAQK
jgi:CheY-like chemotaxis protein